MSAHIHWRRPVGLVVGPYALTRYGAVGAQLYRCRCGDSEYRDRFASNDDVRSYLPVRPVQTRAAPADYED